MSTLIQNAIDETAKAAAKLVNCNEFFFQKAKDALERWLSMPVGESLKSRLLSLAKDYRALQDAASADPALKVCLDQMYEVVSYCDDNARDKDRLNRYEDKRILANAAVRMNAWIHKLILLKFDPDQIAPGSPLNAFNYLLRPEDNVTILSENHRIQVSENLLRKDYSQADFVADLKSFFKHYKMPKLLTVNETHFFALVIYRIRSEWQEEIRGIMASDGTTWKDEYIKALQEYDAGIVWNSRKPTRPGPTLKALRNIIEDGGSFNLYYNSKGKVQYRATVIDFATDQDELNEKQWTSGGKKIFAYSSNFAKYQDGNKRAYIVFLISAFDKIDPLDVSVFEFANGTGVPVQDHLSPIKREPSEVTPIKVMTSADRASNHPPSSSLSPLNQIMFGPPGTGKTFSSIEKALRIIDEEAERKLDWQNRAQVKKQFDRRVEEGRIVFTTFHQSMSYEDFIEGIKPATLEKEGDNITYKVEHGVFRRLCTDAGFAIAQTVHRKGTEEVFDFSWSYDNFLAKTQEKLARNEQVKLAARGGGTVLVEDISTENNFIIKHHNGLRTYTVSKPRLAKLNAAFKNLSEVNNIDSEFREIIGGSNSSAYWAVLNAIRNEKVSRAPEKSKLLTYDERVEVVESLKDEDYSNASSAPRFVMIIDEISRGNVSQIFGELITLLEDDKRLGKPEAIKLTLPYSKTKSFGVPPNLYIVGTMNTADRSVEALDTALRRRFSFEELLPDANILTVKGRLKEDNGVIMPENISLVLLLETINKRIIKLLDKDHLIGHSYFINVSSPSDLKSTFNNKILPLLQEYFFGDPGKIGLVLGKGFFEGLETSGDDDEEIFADFDVPSSDYEERIVYRLKNPTLMTDAQFTEAIKTMLSR